MIIETVIFGIYLIIAPAAFSGYFGYKLALSVGRWVYHNRGKHILARIIALVLYLISSVIFSFFLGAVFSGAAMAALGASAEPVGTLVFLTAPYFATFALLAWLAGLVLTMKNIGRVYQKSEGKRS